ncbi:MAG: hypothetical protein KUG79_15035 [Pseudomonadales bacterium]|nr:hypothetical protein [Pseudomonadales bacterium]
MIRLTLVWTGCLFLFPLLWLQIYFFKKNQQRFSTKKNQQRFSTKKNLDGFAIKHCTPTAGVSSNSKHILGLGDAIISDQTLPGMGLSITAKLADVLASNGITDNTEEARSNTENKALKRIVNWSTEADPVAGIADLIKRLPQMDHENVDLVVVSIGLQDVIDLTSVTRWHFDVVTLVGDLKDQFRAPVVLLGLSDMAQFPGLPQPLRFALGIRAAMLDRALKQAGELAEQVLWVAPPVVMKGVIRGDADVFAADGFHPGIATIDQWVVNIAKQLKKMTYLYFSK